MRQMRLVRTALKERQVNWHSNFPLTTHAYYIYRIDQLTRLILTSSSVGSKPVEENMATMTIEDKTPGSEVWRKKMVVILVGKG